MKTVLVTGSSRGIGKAIAKNFAQKSYHVVINCSKSVDELSETYEEFVKEGYSVTKIAANVANLAEVTDMFDEIYKTKDCIDILINNASVSYYGLFNEMKETDWDFVMKNNFYSVLNCTRLALPPMIQHKKGVIINISSMWGEKGASMEAVYAAAKGAVNSFTKSLAKEMGPSGIRVNAISCGVIETEMNRIFSEEERNAIKEHIPLMTFGNPSHVAKLATFIASEEAAYITGAVMNIDGGYE